MMMRSDDSTVIDKSGNDAILSPVLHADISIPEICETVPASQTDIVGPENPIARHNMERTSIGRSIGIPGSVACEVFSDRAPPRKIIPNAFEKHAIASPPMSASDAMTAIEQNESGRLAEVMP